MRTKHKIKLSFIEEKIINLDSYKIKMYADLHEELNSARVLIDDIKGKLKIISIGIAQLSLEMKEVVKKEQYDSLAKQVDDIPIHDFITKKELKKFE